MSEPRPLILYGVPLSQPVRAVVWLLLNKQMPFEMVLTIPGYSGENGTRHPSYLARNPGGTVPMIEEPDTGFVLGEAHAIMCYLCDQNGWNDLYPANLRQRARVDWYLHYHHRSVREASVCLVAPKFREDRVLLPDLQAAAEATFSRALDALDMRWLADSRFLAGDQPTIADFAAYVEVGQLQPCFGNLYDFGPFPNLSRWMEEMKQVEGHGDAHLALTELGDISLEAPSPERIRAANIKALKRFKEESVRPESSR